MEGACRRWSVVVQVVPPGRIPVGYKHLWSCLLEACPQELPGQRAHVENQLEGKRELLWWHPDAVEKWEPGSRKWWWKVGLLYCSFFLPVERGKLLKDLWDLLLAPFPFFSPHWLIAFGSEFLFAMLLHWLWERLLYLNHPLIMRSSL